MKAFLKHTFSRKAIIYRIAAFVWVFGASWFWTGDPFKSIELTITIVLGKMIIYGVMEHYHARTYEVK